MFDKFLKMKVIKNSKETRSSKNSSNLDQLLSKFDSLEQELILKGPSLGRSNFIPHPIKQICSEGRIVKHTISRDILKRRDENVVALGKDISNLLLSFDVLIPLDETIEISCTSQKKSFVSVIQFSLSAELSQTDATIIEIFKFWNQKIVNGKTQIAIERNSSNSKVLVSIIFSKQDDGVTGV